MALEAIGGYARKLVAALIEAGVTIFLVDPRRIKAFRDAEGLRAKTDRLDASLIARFAHAMADELRPLADTEQAVLKALSTRGRQLTNRSPPRKRVSNRLSILSRDDRHFGGETSDHRTRSRPAYRAEDRMARRRAILTSVPGIGPRISSLLVVEMPELGMIDRKAAASLAGLAPHPSQSGLSTGRNAISGGRPCVRAAFYMAALVASRSNPKFRRAYRQLETPENPPRSPSSPSPGARPSSQTPSSETT